jgi:hypothetical protein
VREDKGRFLFPILQDVFINPSNVEQAGQKDHYTSHSLISEHRLFSIMRTHEGTCIGPGVDRMKRASSYSLITVLSLHFKNQQISHSHKFINSFLSLSLSLSHLLLLSHYQHFSATEPLLSVLLLPNPQLPPRPHHRHIRNYYLMGPRWLLVKVRRINQWLVVSGQWSWWTMKR